MRVFKTRAEAASTSPDVTRFGAIGAATDQLPEQCINVNLILLFPRRQGQNVIDLVQTTQESFLDGYRHALRQFSHPWNMWEAGKVRQEASAKYRPNNDIR